MQEWHLAERSMLGCNVCFVKDLSLSSFLADSPTKKQSTLLSEGSHTSTTAVIVTQTGSGSLLGPVVHFADSSRDSAVLAGVSRGCKH